MCRTLLLQGRSHAIHARTTGIRVKLSLCILSLCGACLVKAVKRHVCCVCGCCCQGVRALRTHKLHTLAFMLLCYAPLLARSRCDASCPCIRGRCTTGYTSKYMYICTCVGWREGGAQPAFAAVIHCMHAPKPNGQRGSA
jgi:hypothetical protein